MSELPVKKYYTPHEVAAYFSVAVSTVYNWCAEGRMESVKKVGVLRIPRKELEGMDLSGEGR